MTSLAYIFPASTKKKHNAGLFHKAHYCIISGSYILTESETFFKPVRETYSRVLEIK